MDKNTSTNINTNVIRQATTTERLRSRAVGISALVVMLMLTVAITFTALTLGGTVGGGVNDDNKNSPPVSGRPTLMALPVASNAQILHGYTSSLVRHPSAINGSVMFRHHRALSIGAPALTPVLAPYNGTIASVTHSLQYGNIIRIEHGHGLVTLLKSVDNVGVKAGDQVTKGQPIATVGTTSNVHPFASQPHVRIEMRDYEKARDSAGNAARINPEDFFNLEGK